MITNIFLALLWIIICASLWMFAVAGKIENIDKKYLEFKIKSFFYWIACLASFLIGYLINGQ